ncbi:MAG: penicillin acylase family protein [Candidatus Limnocylindria bacterium]
MPLTTRGRLAALLAAAGAVAVAGAGLAASAPLAAVSVVGAAILLFGMLAAGAVGAAWLSLVRSAPLLDGEVAIGGTRAGISIRRDHLGTPHVHASSLRDASLGLGVAMAQDRLWQMDLLRRAASGRVAEVAGADAVKLDVYARTIGFRRSAEREIDALTDEERDLLDGFVTGVNAVIDRSIGRGRAFEFALLRYRPEPWSMLDTLAIAKALGWLLSSSLEVSLLTWRISDRLGREAADRFTGPPGDAERPTPAPREIADLASLDDEYRRALGGGGSRGSNVWAVSGRHTRSGRPLLANDIHLGLEYTTRLYEARVDGGDARMSGVFIPGAPLALGGTNGTIAWGATNTGVAVSDVYLEELSEDGLSTRHDGRWEPVRESVEEIAVRGGATRRVSVRSSRHGPLISDLVPAIAAAGRRAFAVRWAGSEVGPPMTALLGIIRSATWEDFNAACDTWTVPAISFGYADADGHIGLRVAGAIPIRARSGLLPLDGTDAGTGWLGWHPSADNPRELDPTRGWLASANDRPMGAEELRDITWLPEPAYRARRIGGLLAAFVDRGRPVGLDEMAQIQRDTVSLHALELLPAMLARLDRETLSPTEESARRHLEDWNASLSVDSVAASIWEAWYRRWLASLLEDRLDPAAAALALDIPRLNPGGAPWSLADAADHRAWLTESSSEILARASFRDALSELVDRLGRDESGWGWGSLHGITWSHPAARSRLLGWLLNRGPYPAPGDAMTVNAAEFRLADPYATVLAPVSRFLVDLADAEAPRFGTHPGQSADPLSPHYDDRISEFRRGETHVTRGALDGGGRAHHLRLVPRGG